MTNSVLSGTVYSKLHLQWLPQLLEATDVLLDLPADADPVKLVLSLPIVDQFADNEAIKLPSKTKYLRLLDNAKCYKR